MISHERPSPFQRRPFVPRSAADASYYPAKPPVQEDTLKTAQFLTERKIFRLDLKENVRGRMLRIIEDCGGRFNSIIIPATGLAEFQRLLAEMVAASAEIKSPAGAKPEAGRNGDDLAQGNNS